MEVSNPLLLGQFAVDVLWASRQQPAASTPDNNNNIPVLADEQEDWPQPVPGGPVRLVRCASKEPLLLVGWG